MLYEIFSESDERTFSKDTTLAKVNHLNHSQRKRKYNLIT